MQEAEHSKFATVAMATAEELMMRYGQGLFSRKN
jgi:hypothetical protein